MVFENPPATELITIPGVQTLEKGGELNSPVVAVERFGPEDAPVILIFTGLSPGAHVASSEKDKSPGWWEFMVGAGKAIDTNKFHVICVNSIGSCRGSTGPASINPDTSDYYGAGGGIYNVYGSTLNVTDSYIDSNLADHDGGGIYQHLSTGYLNNTDVTNNVAGAFTYVPFDGTYGPFGHGPSFDYNGGDGGGIKNHDSSKNRIIKVILNQ